MSLATLLLAAALAQADVPLPPPPPGASLHPGGEAPLPPPPPPVEPSADVDALPRFGLAIEGGLPAGGTLGLLYRPFSALRVWAGPAWNYASFGVHAGAALQPWRLAVSPVLSVEAGRYFSSDVSFLANDSSGVPEGISPLMEDVRYMYGAAHLGFELGSPRGFALSLRAGLAWISVLAKGTARTTSDGGAGSGTATVEFDDPRLRGTVPSVKLGLQYWF